MTEAELLKLMQGGERVWQSSVEITLGRGIAARRQVDFERPQTAAGRHPPGSHPSVWQGLYHPVRAAPAQDGRHLPGGKCGPHHRGEKVRAALFSCHSL